jgi:hypothetical protein
MSITQKMCTSAKAEFLGGIIDVVNDTLKIALYTSNATLNDTTTIYSSVNEVVGSGYIAGGNTLTSATIGTSGTTAFVSFANTTWSASTITASGALIYDSSKANRAIAVLSFGSNKSSNNSNFVIQFPPNDVTSAILRIS